MDVSCQDLSCAPTVDATAVANANGDPIDGCTPQDGEYYVSVALSDGAGNDFYDVSVNGGTPVAVASGSSSIIGPVNALTVANITVTGQTNPNCSGQATVSLSDICPPANDYPCAAVVLQPDGVPSGPYNTAQGTIDPNEVSPDGTGCVSDWCEGTITNTLWFQVTVPDDASRIRISACNAGTDFDTQLAAYSVGDCSDYST